MMNAKLYMGILLLAALALRAVGADRPPPELTVAVYGFSDADRNSGGFGAKVTSLVTASLTGETNLVMVERSELKKALGEQAIGISGMVSSDTAAKIGQVTGARVLVGGQVIKTDKNHLVVVANIIGTDTGRLFAVKVEGATEGFVDLTGDLSRKIAQKIRDESASFLVESKSRAELLNRIVKNVTGTNRPTVSVAFHFPMGPAHPSSTSNGEMGLLLQKAGFTVVDGKSDRKPDVEITGVVDISPGPRRGDLFSCRAVIDIKVQERHTGNIIAYDRESGDSVDVGRSAADRAAQARAVDGLAERILPLLAR